MPFANWYKDDTGNHSDFYDDDEASSWGFSDKVEGPSCEVDANQPQGFAGKLDVYLVENDWKDAYDKPTDE